MYKGILLGIVVALLATGLRYYLTSEKTRLEVTRTESAFESPDLRQQRFDRAVARLRLGDDPDALEEIQRLALSEPDFVPAHQYLIDRMIASGEYRHDRKSRFKLFLHLTAASESGDDSAISKLAQLCISINDHDQAIELLRSIVDSQPVTNALLAQLLMRRGENDEATEIMQTAVARFRKHLEINPTDVDARKSLALNLSLLNKHAEAADVLRDKIDEFPEFREQMFDYVIRAVDAALEEDKAAAFELLNQAVAEDPMSLPIWSRIMALSLTSGEWGQRAKKLAEEASTTHGIAELAKGIQAYELGRTNDAVSELEQAYEISPNNAQILEKLAWYLAKSEPSQLDRAMTLADRLVDTNHDELKLRETRGQILAMLDRQDEAIYDLELALQVMPMHPPLVTTLASLYEKKGEFIKAAALRNKADPTRDDAAWKIDTHELLSDVLGEIDRDFEQKAVSSGD